MAYVMKNLKSGVVVYAFNPSTQKTEAGRSLEFKAKFV